MTTYYQSLDEVLATLDSDFGQMQRRLEDYKEALVTGRSRGIQGRVSKTEAQLQINRAHGSLATLDQVRRMLREINPEAIHQLSHVRMPDWTCPRCGTELKPEDLLHSNKYCEFEGDECNNEPEFIIETTYPLPNGGNLKFKVCSKHLADMLTKYSGTVNPIIKSDPDAIRTSGGEQEARDIVTKAIEETGEAPESFTLTEPLQ